MSKNKNSQECLYSSLDGSPFCPTSRHLDYIAVSQEHPYGYPGTPPPSDHENEETLECIRAQKMWSSILR